MKEIKTKEFVDAQEVFESVTDLGDLVHRGLGRGGDYARNLADDGQVSSDEYAADQLQYAAEGISYEAGHIAVDMAKAANKGIRKAAERKRQTQVFPKGLHTTKNAGETSYKPATATGKATVKATEKSIKGSQKAIKTSQESARIATKATQEAAHAAAEA